ncbi:hypothetical protein M153_11958000207, partial [Pseudoloma neurophilia]
MYYTDEQMRRDEHTRDTIQQFLKEESDKKHVFYFANLRNSLLEIIQDKNIFWEVKKIEPIHSIDTKELDRIAQSEWEYGLKLRYSKSFELYNPTHVHEMKFEPLGLSYTNLKHKMIVLFFPTDSISPYRHYTIPFHIILDSTFPIHPPLVFTPLYHPSVYQSRMCLLREKWTSHTSLKEVLIQILIALEDPLFSLDDSYNEEVVETYINSQKEKEKKGT